MPKKNIRTGISAVIFFLTSLVAVNFANASFLNTNARDNIGNSAQNVGGVAGFESNVDLANIIGVVIQTFLGILGVIFLVYMLYAGYNWMIAQGDEERVTKAKETIQRAIIGLIVTIASYAISYWVFEKLITNTNIIN